MAGMTTPQPDGRTPGSAQARPGDAVDVPADPRAVRVRLASTSRLGDEPPLRVAPAPEELRLTNPTIGVGPLGGMALLPGPASSPDPVEAVPDPAADGSMPPVGARTGEATVLAQRQLLVDGVPTQASIRSTGRGRHVLDEAGERTRLILEAAVPGEGGTTRREVLVDGFRFDVEIESERIAALRERATRGRVASAHSGHLEIKAIIPGKVVSVSVAAGDEVSAGQQLLVVEAMKMQNELRSPRDGTIDRVAVAVGVNIEVGDLLVVIS